MSAADTRRDTGDFYPGGKRIVTTPVTSGGDVKHSDFADVTVETNTIPKMRQAIETLAQKLGATVSAIAIAVASIGAGFDSVPVNEIDFDENPSVVTNVTFDGLLTQHQPLTNYYSKAETDAKIVELAPAPGNYSVVSNKAMTALQSYTETDPTISAWAKAATKPTYSAIEVGALPISGGRMTGSIEFGSNEDVVVDISGITIQDEDDGLITGVSFDNTELRWWWGGRSGRFYYEDIALKGEIPTVPTAVGAFTNDVGYLTSYIESDPEAAGIASNVVTQAYIQEKLGVYLYIGQDGGIYVHTNQE